MRCILVTGFGAFPSASSNPTLALIRRLEAHKPRLMRLGIGLETRVLPVVYTAVESTLAALESELQPDAILHFGLAGRRTKISIETRALNRIGQLRPDAAKACADEMQVLRGGPFMRRSTFPALQINAALRRAGLPSTQSIDAGDYVCNQTLYTSLSHSKARSVGFIHVPRLRRLTRPSGAAKTQLPDLDELVRAALCAIMLSRPVFPHK